MIEHYEYMLCNVIPGISDHEAVLTSFMAQAVYHKESHRKCYLWSRANFQGMNVYRVISNLSF